MKIKQRPEDFSVIESYRFDNDPHGEFYVYRMDKQKLSTLQAVERLRERFRVKRQDVSFCGLKDKQGRTEQLIAIRRKLVQIQDADLRLTLVGRSKEPLSAANITSNRFSVIVRDLSEEDCERLPESVAEVARVGVVNYFDSQRFGFVKHGQGFIAKDLLRGDFQSALKALIAKPSELDRSEDAKIKAWFRDHWGEWHLSPPHATWLKYRPLIERLRDNPMDYAGALMALDRRMRAMIVFELQSALWNEAVDRYVRGTVGEKDIVFLRYQLGALAFPRALPPEAARAWGEKTFPLLGPDSTFTDPTVEKVSLQVLARHKLNLPGLRVPKVEAFHFKHEERPLVIFPGKLRASEPREDEENRGRFKVVLSFTLPPGAYATLVVRRVLWFALPEHHGPQLRRGPGRPVEGKRPAPRRFQREEEEAGEEVEAAPARKPSKRPAGKRFEGKRPERKGFEGKTFARPEGERPERKGFARPEGKRFEGERPERKSFARPEGRPEGKRFEGERAEGSRPEGKRFEGKRPQGARPGARPGAKNLESRGPRSPGKKGPGGRRTLPHTGRPT